MLHILYYYNNCLFCFRIMFYSDPVTYYTMVVSYRTKEYAQKANWVLLQPAELLFSQINSFIFTGDKGTSNHFFFSVK